MYKKIVLTLLIILLVTSPIYAKSLNWQPVNYSDSNLIRKSGLTVKEFNNLSQSEWLELFNGKDKVNFAFNATDQFGNDITDRINPNLSINIIGSNGGKNTTFSNVEIDESSPPPGELPDSLNDNDNNGYLDIWYLEQLAYIGTNLTQNYELKRSLDFNNANSYLNSEVNKSLWTTGEGWVPIDEFNGTFDGNGFAIKNLYINRPSKGNQGLFGYIPTDSEYKNLILEDVAVVGDYNVGGLIGFARAYDWSPSINAEIVVKQVGVTGFVNGRVKVGGLVGLEKGFKSSGNSLYLKNSYSHIDHDETASYFGGLIGNASGHAPGYSYSFLISQNNYSLTKPIGRNSRRTHESLFYNKDIYTGSSVGTGLTTSEIQTAQTFIDAGWNTDVWELKDGQYPKLKFNK